MMHTKTVHDANKPSPTHLITHYLYITPALCIVDMRCWGIIYFT